MAETEYLVALGEGYRNLGKVLLAGMEYQKAVTALERAVDYGAVSEEVMIDLATAYFHTYQYEKAIPPLERTLAANPRSTAAHHMLGKVNFMLRQFDKAASELEAALKLAPADIDVAYTLALARLKQQRVAPARQIFNLMLQRLGSRPEVHNLFGRGYRETGHLDEAIAEFKKAIALNPKYPRVHYNLGLTYLLKDGTLKLNEAAAEFRTELKMYPEEFLALYNLGVVCVVERQYEEAASLLEKAARLRPENPDVRLFLGNAYHGLRQYEKAIESLAKAMELNPEMDKNSPHAEEAHFLLGQSLVRVGRVEEGQKELEIARELKAKALATDREKIVAYLNPEERRDGQPGTEDEGRVLSVSRKPDAKKKDELKRLETLYGGVVAKIHNQTGLLHADGQDFRSAIEHFRSAIVWDPGLAGAGYNLGLAYHKTEQHKEAIGPLELELKNDSSNLSAKHLLGICYFTAEDYRKASALLAEVLPSRPNNVGLYYMLSLSLIKEGKMNEAGDIIRKMLLTHGDSAQVHVLLGQAHHAGNEDEKALEELKKATEMDSRLPMARYYSGLIYIKMGRFDEAAREFEAELRVNPGDIQAKFHLGVVLLTNRQTERGMRLMREVIEQKPDYADARFELGKALLSEGDVKGAIETLETAVKLGPDKPHIHYQLGRAYTAAGREADAQKSFELFKQLKENERKGSNPM
ncbi:MAG TPA: tetratricopeptide repeat protein [Blastocatellia bacterium]|nr:tetratricopeptide repeat protein [Blastocatellia bacterium]